MNNTKSSISWVWVVIAFILFWPVGVVLLLVKLSGDRSAAMRSGRNMVTLSYVLIGIGIICLIAMIGGGLDMVIALFTPMLLFGGGGIALYIIGRRTAATSERYKKYINVIINQGETSIDNIAAAVGVPYATAVEDLQKMINRGYLTGMFINIGLRSVVMARVAEPRADGLIIGQERLLVCGSCGANNKTVVGKISECEYCGSMLQ